MSVTPQPRPPRPATGQPQVDAALAGVDELDGVALDERLRRLTVAHEELHRALSLEQPGR